MKRIWVIACVWFACAVLASQVTAQCVNGMCYRGFTTYYSSPTYAPAPAYRYGTWGVSYRDPSGFGWVTPVQPIRNALRRIFSPMRTASYYMVYPAAVTTVSAPEVVQYSTVSYDYPAATIYPYYSDYAAVTTRPYYGGGVGIPVRGTCNRATWGGGYYVR